MNPFKQIQLLGATRVKTIEREFIKVIMHIFLKERCICFYFPVHAILLYLFNSELHEVHTSFLDLSLNMEIKVHCVGVCGEVISHSLVSTTWLLQAVGLPQLLSTASTLHLNLFWEGSNSPALQISPSSQQSTQ